MCIFPLIINSSKVKIIPSFIIKSRHYNYLERMGHGAFVCKILVKHGEKKFAREA